MHNNDSIVKVFYMEDFYLKMRDGEKIFIQYSINQEIDTTLLYVHGGPGQGCWDFKYAANLLLKSSNNIIMYDQRGVLRSNAVTDKFSSELLISDLEEIRKHFNIDKLILYGHSYGGHLILRYALKYPNYIEKLIYICPTFDFKSSIKNVYRIGYEFMRSSKYIDKLNALKETVNDDTLKSYVDHLIDIPGEIREKIYFTSSEPKHVKDVIFDISATEEDWRKGIEQQKIIFDEQKIYKNYIPLLEHLTIPSLLIVGDHDPICCDVQQKAFVSNPNNTIAIIKNAGHSPYRENAEELVYEINKYLNKI